MTDNYLCFVFGKYISILTKSWTLKYIFIVIFEMEAIEAHRGQMGYRRFMQLTVFLDKLHLVM